MKARKLPLIFPTASFAALVFVLTTMWYAASSQNSAAIYLLLFALTGVFLVSIPHTLINLAGVRTRLESAKPAFADDEVSLPVEIMNTSRATRYGIELVLSDANKTRERIDYIPPEKAARLTLRFPARQRGEHKIGTLWLTSAYLVGFVRVVKKIAHPQTYLVYPKPAGDPRLPASLSRSPASSPQINTKEGDDFSGVRAYVPGESQRHIDWKAVARGQPLMTKQFAAEPEGSIHLDFSLVPSSNVEARLSQLALWVIEAERARRPYGLRLPGTKILPAIGPTHFHRCLHALSLFRSAGDEHD